MKPLNKKKARNIIKAYEDDFYSTEALVMSYLTGEEPNAASKISIDDAPCSTEDFYNYVVDFDALIAELTL